MSDGLNVIHCLRAPLGGLFRHVCDLAEEQCRRGLRVGVICDSGGGGGHAERSLARLAPSCALGVHRLAMTRLLGWSDVTALRGIDAICRKRLPDLLHGHGAKGGAYARLLARRLGARSLYTPHGGSLHYRWRTAGGALFLGLERLLAGRSDGLIFESHYSAETFAAKVGPPACPWRVIHNGLHDEELVPLPTGLRRHDFVFVGELRRLKGLWVLLEALARLRPRGTTLLIAGAGADEAALRALARELDLESLITWSPPIHPAREAMRRAGCMVLPSLAESLPYIVLETIGARMPLIATRVGGLAEIYGPASADLLPPGQPEALAVAMAAVLDDRSAAERRAAELHAHVARRFRVATMADEVLDFYQQVLAAPCQRASLPTSAAGRA